MKIFSRYSRKSLRLNAGAQVAIECTKSFTNVATVPIRVSQACISAVTATRSDNYVECTIHALHATVALTQAALIIAIAFDTQCYKEETDLCRAAFVLELLYQGMLLFSWSHSEFNRDNHAEISLDNNMLSS